MIAGEFEVPSYRMTSPALLCRYCVPGVEFYNAKYQQCTKCTLPTSLICHESVTPVACSATRNTHCPPVSIQITNSFCSNNFLDFGEQCDASAKYTKTSECCTDTTCMLLDGYYTDPPCSTICGDNIVAGSEECDSLTDSQCDMTICKIK